jgi:hypothetical protein
MTGTKLNWRAPKRLTSGDEVGRSILGQKIPRSMRGSLPKRTLVMAWAPLTVSVVLGVGYAATFPTVELVWLRVLYLVIGGAIWTGLKVARNHYAQVTDSMHREYAYAHNELMPALHYSGALVSTSQTIRLMKGETLVVGHNTNLYQANKIRLDKEPDGTDAVQFLFG